LAGYKDSTVSGRISTPSNMQENTQRSHREMSSFLHFSREFVIKSIDI